MQRTVRVLDGSNRPLRGARVALVRHGQRHEALTGSDGVARIDCDEDWVDELTVDGRAVQKDIDLSGGWFGGSKQDLGTVTVGDNDSSGATRSVRLRYDDGGAVAGKLVEFVHGDTRSQGRTADNGVVSFAWQPDWINAVLVEGTPVARDLDLSGGWFGGSKQKLDDIVLSRAGSGPRRLRLRYSDGQPVAGREVAFVKGDERISTVTAPDGTITFSWPHEWADRVEVEQLVVKRDWDLSSFSGARSDLGELVIPRPEVANPADNFRRESNALGEGQEQGVRGLLFYRDGTLSYESFRVEVEFQADFEETSLRGQRFSTENQPSYCRDNGEFFIATPEYRARKWVARMYVDGDEVPRNMFFRTASGVYAVVLPPRFMRGSKGTKGGLITGIVVNPDGGLAARSKISAEVANSGWLPTNEPSVTYTDNKGRFVLPFAGGSRIKRLTVDGSEPSAITIGKAPNARAVANRDIPAGTFNLRIVRVKKAFGGLA